MWSRRTSTRKNLRAQISQVYFLSPCVNRCLFMLLLQENTCAKKRRRGKINDPRQSSTTWRRASPETDLATDGTGWRLFLVLGSFFSIGLELLSFHVAWPCNDATSVSLKQLKVRGWWMHSGWLRSDSSMLSCHFQVNLVSYSACNAKFTPRIWSSWGRCEQPWCCYWVVKLLPASHHYIKYYVKALNTPNLNNEH